MVTMVHAKGKFLTFWPSRLLENVFPTFLREATSSCRNIKIKLTLLKKVSKAVHFIDFFLCEWSVYIHF